MYRFLSINDTLKNSHNKKPRIVSNCLSFQLLINLGAELNHQDRATGWTCLMQVLAKY